MTSNDMSQREESWAWILLPLFLGLLGGIIAFLLLRTERPKQANEYLVIGIISFIFFFFLFLLIR